MKIPQLFGSLFGLCLGAAAMAAPPLVATSQPRSDAQRQIDTTLQEFVEAKTDAQRAAAEDFLQHFDRRAVVAAVIAHIEHSRTGREATIYNGLIDVLKPDSCAELIRQLAQTEQVEDKAKIVVALRHCEGEEVVRALASTLGDKRPVHFEAHGKQPRRVCDLAYDELFLKLHADPKFGLDPSPRLRGIIRESTPVKERNALVAKLARKLATLPAPSPTPSASPASPSPMPAKPKSTPAASGAATATPSSKAD